MKTLGIEARLLKRFFSVALLLVSLLLAACGGLSSEPQTPEESPPSTPTGLTAVAGNAQVQLTWSANSEADLSHYNVWQGTARGDLFKVAEVPKGTESYLASNLPNGIAQHFALEAVLINGETSEATEEVSATPQADIVTPSTCLFNSSESVFGSCTFGN